MKRYVSFIVIVVAVFFAALGIRQWSSQHNQPKSEAQQAMPPGHPNVAGNDADVSQAHPPVGTTDADVKGMDFSGIELPAGGTRIADIHANAKDLSGKTVTVRGKVVKVTPGVMGKNWIHIHDGTGSDATADLTVTTDATVKVGDLVLVKGTLATNKDFGVGYTYDVIVQDAQVTVE